jgi:hypothetical protein
VDYSDDLDNRFRWHQPRTQEVGELHNTIRRECRELAGTIMAVVPAGREQALAITKLEEAMMWANAGIARAGGTDADGI